MEYGLNNAADTDNSVELSRLELTVLTLAAHGLREPEIASRLPMSKTEICSALMGATQKLGAGNRMQAIAFAIRRGLIGVEV